MRMLLIWSYVMVVFQDPGSVPENWKLISDQSVEEEVNSISISGNLGPHVLASYCHLRMGQKLDLLYVTEVSVKMASHLFFIIASFKGLRVDDVDFSANLLMLLLVSKAAPTCMRQKLCP